MIKIIKRKKHNALENKDFMIISISVVLFLSMLSLNFLTIDNSQNTLTGKATSKVTIIKNDVITNLTLYQGFNYFGLRSIFPADPATVLNPINNNYSHIYTYLNANNTDPWKVYKKDLPIWVNNDLKTINVKMGLIIYMYNDSTYFYNGSSQFDRHIDIHPGWNYISYPSSYDEFNHTNISQALNSIKGNYSKFMYYNRNISSWILYNSSDNNSIKILNYTKSYWLFGNMSAGTSDLLIINPD